MLVNALELGQGLYVATPQSGSVVIKNCRSDVLGPCKALQLKYDAELHVDVPPHETISEAFYIALAPGRMDRTYLAS